MTAAHFFIKDQISAHLTVDFIMKMGSPSRERIFKVLEMGLVESVIK